MPRVFRRPRECGLLRAMILFRPMSPTDFLSFRERSVENHARDLKDSGVCPEGRELAVARATIDRRMDAGLDSENQHFFTLVKDDDEAPVGHIWFEYQEREGQPTVVLWDIELAPEYRSRGYGRLAMGYLEDFAQNLGAEVLQFKVFGHNDGGRRFYEKLGYGVKTVTMVKRLEG